MTTTQWITFFKDAGVSAVAAENYAAKFVKYGIGRESVETLNWDDLQSMKITEVTDIKCILAHAKRVDSALILHNNKTHATTEDEASSEGGKNQNYDIWTSAAESNVPNSPFKSLDLNTQINQFIENNIKVGMGSMEHDRTSNPQAGDVFLGTKKNTKYDEYILEIQSSSTSLAPRKRGRPKGSTTSKKSDKSGRRTSLMQRRRGFSAALADGKKLYEASQFDDPAKERSRLNAINAKFHRERRAKEKEALVKELESLKQENKGVLEEAEAAKQRADEAERRLEEANVARTEAEEAKGKEALYILTILEENKRLREETEAAKRRTEEAEAELEKVELWAMGAVAEMGRMQTMLRVNGLEFKAGSNEDGEDSSDQILP